MVAASHANSHFGYTEWVRCGAVYFLIRERKMLYRAVMLIKVAQSNLPQASLALPVWQGI